MNTTAALKKTKKQLHESGFKLTPQREATLLVLLENENCLLYTSPSPRDS